MTKNLILGSSSPYRRTLLERLKIPFTCHSPDIDETHQQGESAKKLVQRLSTEKAKAVQIELQSSNALIIASDQVAVLGDSILGKPHTHDKAVSQLMSFSHQKVSFLTGLCLLDTSTMTHQYTLNEYHVYFRALERQEVENYVRLEKPLDCAGSFKCEGLGVTLFEKMEGDDPNSLIGLPLISLCKMLRRHNISPLS